MKIYVEYGENIIFEGLVFPKNTSNRDYNRFLEELQNGEAELIPYTALLPTWNDITAKRDQLLKNSDYKVLPDANPETKDAWMAYRDILRNITETFSTPESVIWPIPPEI